MKLVPTESEEKMGTTETKDHEGAGSNKYGGKAWQAVFLLLGLNVKMTGPPTLAAKPPLAVVGPSRLTC